MFTFRIDEELELSLVDRILAPKMVEIILTEKKYLGKWLAWPEHTKSIDDYLEYVAMVSADYAAGKGMSCNIIYKGHPVGTVGFNYINKSLKKAEIGYWLSERAQGNGIMTRCCKRLIDVAFNDLMLEKIEIPGG